MAKNKHVAATDIRMEKTFTKMSREMAGHALDTAIGNGHGHAMGNVAGNTAPNNDHSLQAHSFVPQRVLAGPSQVSGGGFQQGGAAGADYETTSVGDTPDCDSGGPTGS